MEFSEEEKKAIETTKTIIEYAGDSYIPKENRKALQIILNLIEKQQKEIEEMREDLQMYVDEEYKYEHIIKELKEKTQNLLGE